MIIRCVSLVLVFGFAVSAAFAGPREAVQLRDRALTDGAAWNILESLTTEIGPRPAGSPAAQRARDWAVAKFTALGFTNIHVEAFAKPAWVRGPESAEIVAPFPQKLALIGLGSSVPTPPEGITADIVVVKSLAELKAAPANAFAGKIVVLNQPMTRTQGTDGYASAVAGRYAPADAAKRGALAYLVRSISTSTARAPHTGVTRYEDGVAKIPAAALGVPDAELLEHMAARGPVRLHLILNSHVDQGAMGYTVSGDIAGSTAPDQFIVIGGHLDSWDPGTGAIDDGAGVAITMAAARLIGNLPQHPARTIRVVLWGSEETGGSGDAYLAAHKNTLDQIVLAGESDVGADNVYELQLPQGTVDAPALAGLPGILAPLKVIVSSEAATDAGSDVDAIQGAGVPVLALKQDASRYFDYHHSADDTLAIVDPVQLNQNVAAWAATLDLLADSGLDFRKARK